MLIDIRVWQVPAGSRPLVDGLRFAALFIVLLSSLCRVAPAAVLPEERADLLWHRYDGGGAVIEGPSLLLRKNVGESVSVGLNHYIDNVTSASIDVLVSASEYTENREENGFALDYLRQKTTVSFGYVRSDESDYEANTLSLGISQDMFGDLTTVSMSFALGDNTVRRNGDNSFEEGATVRSYRVGVSQIVSKNLVMALTYETISDEGYLNNPYRSVRYLNPDGITYSFEPELYPNTRTSTAIALRGNYYLERRAAIHGGVRIFDDTWDIEALTYEAGYTMPYGEDWILEFTFRLHDQGQAEFYSDLFPFAQATNYRARDKELSSFTSTTFGFGAAYEFGRAWSAIERGSINVNLDLIQFDYDNFRDITGSQDAGEEPLYGFDAQVWRIFTSIWF